MIFLVAGKNLTELRREVIFTFELGRRLPVIVYLGTLVRQRGR